MDVNGDQISTLITSCVTETTKACRVGERIIAAQASVVAAAESLKSVVDLDAELAPEITEAMRSLEEVSPLLERAATFALTRMDVRLDAIITEALS